MTGSHMRTMADLVAEFNSIQHELLTCKFGIPYLDDALLGMSPGEVTLLGAKSGGGMQLRYAAWRKGVYRDIVGQYESDAGLYLKHLLALSETKFHYRRGDLGAREIAAIIEGGASDFNLYVVDHFHAMAGIDRIEEQSEAITLITGAAEKAQRPVLVLGQFRKNSGVNSKCPLPAMEDFSGSSQLVYQPHNIIVMGPKPADADDRYETYFHVVKSRTASDAKPFVGIHSFDIEMKLYSQQYQVARFKPFAEPELLAPAQSPKWAKRTVGLAAPPPRRKSFLEAGLNNGE